MKRTLLVLPGTTGRAGSERYNNAYDLILRKAQQYDFTDCFVVDYPGQDGQSDTPLSYESALNSALPLCRELNPSWIIGRSLGCDIAIGALASNEAWTTRVETAVLWGPTLRSINDELFPTLESRKAEQAGYARYQTIIADDFFETIPSIENILRNVKCDLRFARGSRDAYNSLEDLNYLSAVHKRAQHNYLNEVTVVGGLGHTVLDIEASQTVLSPYYSCLFDPIVYRSIQ